MTETENTWQARLRAAMGTSPGPDNPYPMLRWADEFAAHVKATGNRRVAPHLYDALRPVPVDDEDDFLGHIERRCGALERSTDAGAIDAGAIERSDAADAIDAEVHP